MRIRVDFSTADKKPIFFPWEELRKAQTAVVYQALRNCDPQYADEVHRNLIWRTPKGKPFKLFSFSHLFGKETVTIPEGIFFPSPLMHFYISSPDTRFMNTVSAGFLTAGKFSIRDREAKVEKVIPIEAPKIGNKMVVKTISPLVIKRSKESDKKKVFLFPEDVALKKEAEKLLKKNVLLKYAAYKGAEPENAEFDISILELKKETKSVYKEKIIFLGSFAVLEMRGDPDIIKFAYDAGIGAYTGLGHGFLFQDIERNGSVNQ